MKWTTILSCKDLMGFDVEEEGLNWNRWVPLLINIKGEILDSGQSYGAIPILQVIKISHKDLLPKPCWLMPRAGLYSSGTAR